MRILIALVLLISTSVAFSQKIYMVSFTQSGVHDLISIELDPNVIVNLKDDGSVMNFGVDLFKERGQENYYGTLEKYMGRIEYYTQNDDVAFRGKVKIIGRYAISWYASYDGEHLQGKIKSIGSLNIQYHRPEDEKAYAGKIKSIGNTSVSYYASFENEMVRGKLSAMGSTRITYYGAFDDKAYRGKVKSIGSASFTYYPTGDRMFAGTLKSGARNQYINGIKFFLR